MMENDGKTKDEANKSLDAFIRESVKQWFETGDVNRAEAVDTLATFTSYDTEEARAKVDYWIYSAEHPETAIYDAWVNSYYADAEPYGISMDDYMQYKNDIRGIEGEGKKQAILAVIDAMPLTSAQKDALYLANGWAESKLNEAPWH
jgi:hypothetical protein